MSDLGFAISMILFYLSFAWFFTDMTVRYPYIRRISRIHLFNFSSPDFKVSFYSFSYIIFWLIISSLSFYLYSEYVKNYKLLSLIIGPVTYFMAPQIISPSLTLFIFWKVPNDPLFKDHSFPFRVKLDGYKNPKKSKKLFLLGILLSLFLTFFMPLLLITIKYFFH